MYLEKKKSKSDIIFVFNFTDEEDRDYWINKWVECVNNAPKEYSVEYLKNIISTLKRRIDDKYATDEHKFSGILFLNEFLNFAFGTTYLMCVYNDSTQNWKNISEKYAKLSDEWKALYIECFELYNKSVKQNEEPSNDSYMDN